MSNESEPYAYATYWYLSDGLKPLEDGMLLGTPSLVIWWIK